MSVLEIVEENSERTFFFEIQLKKIKNFKKIKNYSFSAAVIIAPQKIWWGKYGPNIEKYTFWLLREYSLDK